MLKKYLYLLLGLFLYVVLYTLLGITEFGGEKLNYYILSFLFLLPSLIAVIYGFLIVQTYGLKAHHGKAFLYLTLGSVSFLLGELIWIIFYIIGIEPFPSIADFFYLLAYPLIFAGIYLEIVFTKAQINIKKFLALFSSLLVLSSLIFYISTFSEMLDYGTKFENIIAGLYSVADIILAFVALLLLVVLSEYKKGAIFYSWVYILISFVFMLVADLIFIYYYDIYEYNVLITTIADNLWILSYGLYAIGFISYYHILNRKKLEIIEKIKR